MSVRRRAGRDGGAAFIIAPGNDLALPGVRAPWHLSLVKRYCIAAIVVLLACHSDKGGPTTPAVTTATVSFAGGVVTAEIASTTAQRDLGLMNRAALGANDGMLFAFGLDQQPLLAGFWMKNTSIPLSIAFMDAAKRVIGVQDMAPFDTITIHAPATPYRYALEVNQGWFAAHTVTIGGVATFVLPAGTVIDP